MLLSIIIPHHDCPPEWPDFTGSGGGHEDEGAEESGHGISYGFDSNTPLHMPPRIVIAEKWQSKRMRKIIKQNKKKKIAKSLFLCFRRGGIKLKDLFLL